jgi:hypothetical protein
MNLLKHVLNFGKDGAKLRWIKKGIQPSRPGLSAITSVLPTGLGVSLIRKGVTGGWAGSSQTCIVIMAIDRILKS